jgi:hypothetical protein
MSVHPILSSTDSPLIRAERATADAYRSCVAQDLKFNARTIFVDAGQVDGPAMVKDRASK